MRRELTEDEALPPQVVKALQELDVDMNPSMYDAGIDLEAASQFLESSPDGGELTFNYNGVEVSLTEEELVLKRLNSA